MLVLILIITAVCAWLIRMHLDQEKRRVNLPGEKGIPIFGNLFQMNSKPHISAIELHKKFGNVVYNQIFNSHTVLLGDAKLAKELLSLDQLSGRPVFPFFLVYEGEGPFGLGSSEGDLWETHRRFTLRQLRDFGFGKHTMESLIMDEVKELVESIKSKNSEPIGQIKELMTLAVVNSLWTLVNGQRLRQDDPDIRALSHDISSVFVVPVKSGGVIFFMPWLRHIMPKKTGYTEIRQAFEHLKKFILEAVNEHKRTFQPESSRDFIDVYLKEMQTTDPNSTFYGEAGMKQLVSVVADLFFAGTDTTSTTLAWAILYLAKNQEVQKKLHEKISSVTGDIRDVYTSDRPSLPYLVATIDEILRVTSLLPGGVFHSVTTPVTHNGVYYPKDTMVGVSLYWIHHNPETWGDPENFRPERFLSEDESTHRKSDNLIPFSVGKRHCLGESLARESLFLFLGNIVQNFHIICNPNELEPSLEPAPGFTLNPQEYSVMFKNRK